MQANYFKEFSAAVALSLIIIFGVNFTAFGQKENGGKHGDEDHSEKRDDDRGDRKGRGKHGNDRDERRSVRRDDDDDDDDDEHNRADRSRQRQDRGDGNWRERKERRHDRQADFTREQRQINADIWNYGQWRSAQVHEQNARRKEWKDQQKAWRRADKAERKDNRRYDREIWNGQSRDWRDEGDYNNRYDYNDAYNERANWKEQILRSLIGSVIGNRLGGGEAFAPQQYEPYYNRAQSNQPIYYDNAPQYDNNYGTPYSDAYQPIGNYNGGQQYGGSSNLGGLLNALPIGELLGRYAGDGIVGQLLTNFLAQGYDQGFLAGQSARQNGNGDRYYQDPYVTEQGIYNPYSVSMGENRQLLSEGYGLGFQDALNGNTQYDPQSEGSVDLVSLLLNNVLRRI